MRNLLYIIIICACSVFFTSCSIHRIDVQQGNVLTPETVKKLKIGMNQRTVKSILGAPLIQDPFHTGRWDYVYSMNLANEDKSQSSHITLFFEGDSLKSIKVVKPAIAKKDLLKPQLNSR